MSNDSQNHTDQPDPLDGLLAEAFAQAVSGPGDRLLVERVLADIARRQRQRALVLIGAGLIAITVCLLGALPLLGSLQGLLAGLGTTAAAVQQNLPVTIAAIALLFGGGWLLFEEASA